MNILTTQSSYIFYALVLFQIFFTNFVFPSEDQITNLILGNDASNSQFVLTINSTIPDTQVVLGDDLKNDKSHLWRFSVLLANYSCFPMDFIKLDLLDADGKESTEIWKCSESRTRLVDNLIEMNVTFEKDPTFESVFYLVAAVYFDSSKHCSSEFFDCNRKIESIDCDSSSNRVSIRSGMASQNDTTLRCIPWTLKCDGYPSCGINGNDERNEVCRPELYCPSFMMDWAFILTRSVVAIIFVLIPTIVVMLLFHRRQLALHRARMHREAELARRQINQTVAVIEMSELYANDHPPTYDDLYETKEPPPCFCQALGLNDLNTNSTETTDLSFIASNLQNHPDETNITSVTTTNDSSSNPKFECVCSKSSE